jgi:hypothetical protein
LVDETFIDGSVGHLGGSGNVSNTDVGLVELEGELREFLVALGW